MKTILLMLILLTSLTSFSYVATEGICRESNQSVPWIIIDLFEAESDWEQTYAVKYEFDHNGELIQQKTLSSSDSDFDYIKATTDKGERIFIIMHTVPSGEDFTLKQYVCSKNLRRK